jgi:hypothetical protein
MGCPTNAKQSMLVTTIPSALDHGATLLTHARAERFDVARATARDTALQCARSRPMGNAHGRRRRARAHFVVAGGAINSPALLLRSQAPDPHGLLGKRTFLHPTVMSAGVFEQKVEGFRARRRPSTATTSWRPRPSTARSATSWRRRRCIRCCCRPRWPASGSEHADTMRQFPHTHGCWRCCATASTTTRGRRVRLRGRLAGARLPDQPLRVGWRAGAPC